MAPAAKPWAPDGPRLCMPGLLTTWMSARYGAGGPVHGDIRRLTRDRRIVAELSDFLLANISHKPVSVTVEFDGDEARLLRRSFSTVESLRDAVRKATLAMLGDMQ